MEPLHLPSQQAPPAPPHPPPAVGIAASGLASIAQDPSLPIVASMPLPAFPVSGTLANELWGLEGRQREPRFPEPLWQLLAAVAGSRQLGKAPTARRQAGPAPETHGYKERVWQVSRGETREPALPRQGRVFPHLVLSLMPGRMAPGRGGFRPVPISSPPCRQITRLPSQGKKLPQSCKFLGF